PKKESKDHKDNKDNNNNATCKGYKRKTKGKIDSRSAMCKEKNASCNSLWASPRLIIKSK
ncbi:MAG: hypothetical protein M3162_01335, partial [Thermoproteota archaeon]|nr:hypothetical protein [Thermoproteota archaeon]